MKSLILILLSLVLITTLHAKLTSVISNPEKLFPDSKLWNQTNVEEEVSSYGYATNIEFAKAKKILKEKIGKSWKEQDDDLGLDDSSEAMKKQGVELMGNALYRSNEFPGVVIALMQMKMEGEMMGKKYMITLMVTKEPKDLTKQ